MPLSSVLYDPPHSLQEQAYQPRELLHGTVNVDGTGIAWWHGDDARPRRYVTAATPWADPNLPDLASRLTGHTVLAAVRGATPGIGFGADMVAPFVHDRFAFAHNGWIGAFRGTVGAALVRTLPDDLLAGLMAMSDSTVLFRSVLAHHRQFQDLRQAVTEALRQVASVCAAADQPATLNVVVCDGTETVATRVSWQLPGNSLYLQRGDHHVAIASEPLDADGWAPVPDGSLVHVRDGFVTTTPLTLEPVA